MIDAVVELVEKIFEAREDLRNEIGVFCDLSKAFDCVNHEKLIRKLHNYGVTCSELDLLASYLTNRVQKIDVNKTRSSRSVVRMGVSEGSILNQLYGDGARKSRKLFNGYYPVGAGSSSSLRVYRDRDSSGLTRSMFKPEPLSSRSVLRRCRGVSSTSFGIAGRAPR
ncbi:hypothetical protein EVAR_6311_1 [Eumeta japonica]|uniref:Reverse transcriptase domain-containing protein n=1 Tax=Eumeta variegata TaxID=151549 RepID=A0A4C1TBD6_EUMVA|nr:hypothetical protein EVAR_6311_1 [Eumeta japonica]